MLKEYEAAVQDFAASRLDDYIDHLNQTYEGRRATSKEFNDPVWGTLSLSGLEVLILDSPLMQRLRRVRQLGVAHWIYPSALHTRFEHSVGALHMVRRLLDAVADSGTAIPESISRLLRIAALCHDIGHPVMSHVAENSLRYCEAMEDLQAEFTDQYGKEAQLGEINSFLILGSDAFTRLLTAATAASGEAFDTPKPTEVLQNLVLGRPIDPKFPVLHQFISGPFDADKLDYMTRDAYMSGVPLITDVNRLVRKVRAVPVAREKAPASVQRLTDVNTDIVVVIGIHRSGNRTLDELTLGRTLLFDKIYRHQKTRACEAMVAAMLSKVAARAVDSGAAHEAAMIVLRLTDDELTLGHWQDAVAGLAVDDGVAEFLDDMAQRLRDRRHFVRAVEFARKMTEDAYDQDDEQARGLQELLFDAEDPISRREICHAIAELTTDALELVGRSDVVAAWPGEVADYIWLDGVRSAEHLTVPSKAMLVTDDGHVVPFDQEAPETPQWANAYQQTRDSAIVFCPPEISTEVALAAERYMRSRYGVRLPKASLHGARRSPSDGHDERELLARNGFYNECPADLLPPSARLQRGDSDGAFATIATRLHGYCPPLVEPDRAGRDRFSPRLVQDFVAQFRDEDLIDTAISMLGTLELIGRSDVVRPLIEMLDQHPEFESASLVVLGSSGDSSSIATYYALDAAGQYPNLRASDLGSALLADQPILFVDDIVGSGRQAASIVHSWFGDDTLAQELGEKRTALPVEAQATLRARRVGFCFAAALEDGPDELGKALSNFEVDHTIRVGRHEPSLPTIMSVPSVGEDARERFITRCADIGGQLLRGQPSEKREQRVLGYGNKGLLITFPYNTPSQTLTCLWERGEVDGQPWAPLLPRRRKR